jgi:hypothetical protein
LNTPLQKQITDQAVSAFWSSALAGNSPPTIDDWSRGTSQAKKAAIDAVLSAMQSDQFDQAFGEVPKRAREQLPTTIGHLAPDLHISQPLPHFELSGPRLAIIALIGALVGLLALSFLTRFLLDMKDVGLFVGGPLGASLAVWLSIRLANDSILKTILTTALGVSVAEYVARMIAQSSPVGRILSFISQAKSEGAKKRWIAYLLIGLILLLSKREQSFDAGAADAIVRGQLETWTGWLLRNVESFISDKRIDESKDSDQLTKILPALADLRRADEQHQPTAVRQLFAMLETIEIIFDPVTAEARPIGARRTIAWSDELTAEYDTFGEVKLGQLVEIMRDPVSVNNQVVIRGMVKRYFL